MAKITMKGAFNFLKKMNAEVKTLAQVGASYGQEVDVYLEHGVEGILLIEPIPEVFNSLSEKYKNNPNIIGVQAACLDKMENVEFHIASNDGMSSSIFPEINRDMHNIEFVNKINVLGLPLDTIMEDMFNVESLDLLVVDAQGSEMKVFSGAIETLKKTKYIFTEVSEVPLYKGACVMGDVTSFLKQNGFRLGREFLNERGTGDALYWKE